MPNINFNFNYSPALGAYPLPQQQESADVSAHGKTTTQYTIQVPHLYNWASDRARFFSLHSSESVKKSTPPTVTWNVVDEDQRQVQLSVTLSMADLERDWMRRGLKFWKKWPYSAPALRAVSKSLKAYQEQKTRLHIVQKKAISRARESEKLQIKRAKELSRASPDVQEKIRSALKVEIAQPKEISDLRNVLERAQKTERKQQRVRAWERIAYLEEQLAHVRKNRAYLEEKLARFTVATDPVDHWPPAYTKV